LLALSLLVSALLAAVVLTGPSAGDALDALGVGNHALGTWSVAKWPAIAVCFSAVFVIVYGVAVSPKPAGLGGVSAGKLVAVAAWLLAIAGLVFHVANFRSVDETFGGLGTGSVSLLWLTLLGVLYHVTPRLRLDDFGAVLPGVSLSLAAWLSASAGLAASVAVFDPFDSLYGTLGLVPAALAWLWASNLAVLFGAVLNLELDRRLPSSPPPAIEPQTPLKPDPGGRPSKHVVETPTERTAPVARDLTATDVAIALRNDTAHRAMCKILPGEPLEMCALLSELECDLNDWGFAYGVAWAVAKSRYPLESDHEVAARALAAAKIVFREYCSGDDWAKRLAERRAEQTRSIQPAGHDGHAGMPG
jgi:uncharacterized BrkB/YihY/UPF0761 family membrane protein